MTAQANCHANVTISSFLCNNYYFIIPFLIPHGLNFAKNYNSGKQEKKCRSYLAHSWCFNDHYPNTAWWGYPAHGFRIIHYRVETGNGRVTADVRCRME